MNLSAQKNLITDNTALAHSFDVLLRAQSLGSQMEKQTACHGIPSYRLLCKLCDPGQVP